MVSMARPFLADPEFVKKAAEDRGYIYIYFYIYIYIYIVVF